MWPKQSSYNLPNPMLLEIEGLLFPAFGEMQACKFIVLPIKWHHEWAQKFSIKELHGKLVLPIKWCHEPTQNLCACVCPNPGNSKPSISSNVDLNWPLVSIVCRSLPLLCKEGKQTLQGWLSSSVEQGKMRLHWQYEELPVLQEHWELQLPEEDMPILHQGQWLRFLWGDF